MRYLSVGERPRDKRVSADAKDTLSICPLHPPPIISQLVMFFGFPVSGSILTWGSVYHTRFCGEVPPTVRSLKFKERLPAVLRRRHLARASPSLLPLSPLMDEARLRAQRGQAQGQADGKCRGRRQPREGVGVSTSFISCRHVCVIFSLDGEVWTGAESPPG